MGARSFRLLALLCCVSPAWVECLHGQTSAQTGSSSNSPKHVKKPAEAVEPGLDAGAVSNGVYRNKALAMSVKIPAGWVLRTEEVDAREEGPAGGKVEDSHVSQNQRDMGHPTSQPSQADTGEGRGRVLLAAFSRPPEAKGEDVNASILVAAESVEAYPGLKEAAQYFGPLTEVAKAQGFTVDEEPYEIALGTKVLVRGDFHKDVGSRVMRQSTLAFLAHGYAVSITVIGGTEDEVEELVDGVEFGGK